MDADSWLTKAEAATALGVSGRSVERLAARGVLTSRMRPGFPTMYNPDDVDKVASAGRTVHRAALATAVQPPRVNGHGAAALVRHPEPTAEALVEPIVRFLELVTARLGNGPTAPTGPTLFLTLAEASSVSGLSETYLRRQITEQKLSAVKDRGWRIRRRDLEQL